MIVNGFFGDIMKYNTPETYWDYMKIGFFWAIIFI